MRKARRSNLSNRMGVVLVVLLGIVGLCVNTAAALPGLGTQEDPWRIQSLADFDEFAADPNYWSGFTRLETDVNLAGRIYTTAVIAPDVDNAHYDYDGTPFSGVFDGNDHKITNLTIDDGGAGNDYLGLFGCIGEDGEVRDLGLEGGSVSGDGSVGGLVGFNYASVSNCYSTGDVNGNDYVGGLVGYNTSDSTISDCYSTGDVTGDDYVGGLVGENVGSVSNCYATGDVTGDKWVAGLVGCNGGSISHCYSTGNVNGTGGYVGGLVGRNDGERWPPLPGYIINSYSTGDVNGVGYVGGLVGNNEEGSVLNCYSTGDVIGDDCVGGLVGFSWGTVSNCYSTGDVNGVDSVGGLAGGNTGTVSNCYSIGDVTGSKDVGGLVGQNGVWNPRGQWIPGYISYSCSTGSVQGTSGVGGLVGNNEAGEIERSFWDTQTSGEPNMCGYQVEGWATGCDPNCGKTTAEMQTGSTFTEFGWDFVDIWLINEGATYPVLRQEIRSDLNGAGGVDLLDFAVFADHWLEGKGE